MKILQRVHGQIRCELRAVQEVDAHGVDPGRRVRVGQQADGRVGRQILAGHPVQGGVVGRHGRDPCVGDAVGGQVAAQAHEILTPVHVRIVEPLDTVRRASGQRIEVRKVVGIGGQGRGGQPHPQAAHGESDVAAAEQRRRHDARGVDEEEGVDGQHVTKPDLERPPGDDHEPDGHRSEQQRAVGPTFLAVDRLRCHAQHQQDEEGQGSLEQKGGKEVVPEVVVVEVSVEVREIGEVDVDVHHQEVPEVPVHATGSQVAQGHQQQRRRHHRRGDASRPDQAAHAGTIRPPRQRSFGNLHPFPQERQHQRPYRIQREQEDRRELGQQRQSQEPRGQGGMERARASIEAAVRPHRQEDEAGEAEVRRGQAAMGQDVRVEGAQHRGQESGLRPIQVTSEQEHPHDEEHGDEDHRQPREQNQALTVRVVAQERPAEVPLRVAHPGSGPDPARILEGEAGMERKHRQALQLLHQGRLLGVEPQVARGDVRIARGDVRELVVREGLLTRAPQCLHEDGGAQGRQDRRGGRALHGSAVGGWARKWSAHRLAREGLGPERPGIIRRHARRGISPPSTWTGLLPYATGGTS